MRVYGPARLGVKAIAAPLGRRPEIAVLGSLGSEPSEPFLNCTHFDLVDSPSA